MTFCKAFRQSLNFQTVWFLARPVACRMYRQTILTSELNAVLRVIHLSQVTILHRQKLDGHVQTLITIPFVAVRRSDPTLPIEPKVWVVSYYHAFVVCQLGVCVYQRFLVPYKYSF